MYENTEEHWKIIKEIRKYKIFQITRNDICPENVGTIILRTPEGKDFPCSSVKDAEEGIAKWFKG